MRDVWEFCGGVKDGRVWNGVRKMVEEEVEGGRCGRVGEGCGEEV